MTVETDLLVSLFASSDHGCFFFHPRVVNEGLAKTFEDVEMSFGDTVMVEDVLEFDVPGSYGIINSWGIGDPESGEIYVIGPIGQPFRTEDISRLEVHNIGFEIHDKDLSMIEERFGADSGDTFMHNF